MLIHTDFCLSFKKVNLYLTLMHYNERIIYCTSPHCENPTNYLGDRICQSCQTPLVYRYLWAKDAANISSGTKVANRYEVITEQIWLDTQPGKTPEAPSQLPQSVIPYLKLYRERLHIPQPYGIVVFGDNTEDNRNHEIILFENAPIDTNGNLYPIITTVWEQAKAVRQLYWLWQILELWKPLSQMGLAASLLSPENIFVEGWCVKLLELPSTTSIFTLQDLGQSWQSWVIAAKAEIAPKLGMLIQEMCQPDTQMETISHELNNLLLASAGELPLMVTVAGLTDKGPIMQHNEDTCYPSQYTDLDNYLKEHLLIVCDGVGGHEGGEVASQLAVQSAKLQIRAWLQDIAEQTELLTPDLLQQQLAASLRVVNNMIWSCNDEQNRQGRERMATTLLMAIQLPQPVTTNTGWESDNGHELYLASIGDSRAYWITPHYCQLLTIDDDMATKIVSSGKSLYRHAMTSPHSNALTQALGTKEAESLEFNIERFILEEDGVLLLCSDGLSDHDWVEKSWQDQVIPLLTGKITVEDAVHKWVELANEKNGRDNISVVVSLFRNQAHLIVTPPAENGLEVQEPEELLITVLEPESEIPQLQAYIIDSLAVNSPDPLDLNLTLEGSTTTEKTNSHKHSHYLVKLVIGLFVLFLGSGGIYLWTWREFQPRAWNQICQQLPEKLQQFCLKQ